MVITGYDQNSPASSPIIWLRGGDRFEALGCDAGYGEDTPLARPEAAFIVIDPFTATTLGGLAYDTAKTAITKWVGARITAGLDTALRNRQLMQGRPAKDQQIELAALIKAAAELTANEQFAGEGRLQGRFRKALLDGSSQDWPLVNGSELTELVADVHAWISKNDPQPGSSQYTNAPAAHPYLSVLCRNITR